MGHLVLSGIQGDLSLDPSKANSGWIRLAEDQVSIAHIQLNGTSEVYIICMYMYAYAHFIYLVRAEFWLGMCNILCVCTHSS